MAEDRQAPYRGPDPFLQDVPQGWAEHLLTLRPVPRSICAVLGYVPPWLRAQAWLEIFEAEAGAANRNLEKLLAQERAYRKTLTAAQEADRQRRSGDAAAPGHDAPSPPHEPPP
ncbi:hypothetical protein [Streptomyces violens]|uniref:hypothetical protein n=1 Tax=Streptomyces violens TaxID=66377 RepID=UPI00068E1930|nr:hypothetical protein [Streptomyces violens]